MSYLVSQKNPVISILFTFATNLLYSFLTTSLFTTFLNLLKSAGKVFNLSAFVLSNSAFNLAKFDSSYRLDESVPVAFFNSGFVT